MSNSNTNTHPPPPNTGPGHPHSNAVISPVRYESNFLPSVSSHLPPAPYEPSSLSNLPYPLHRERHTVVHPSSRPVISNSTDTVEKDPPHNTNNSNSIPTVGPDLLNNNEVIISNPQTTVSEANQEGDNSNALVPGSKTGQTYVDITEYLNMPQSEAAKKLGIPTSYVFFFFNLFFILKL